MERLTISLFAVNYNSHTTQKRNNMTKKKYPSELIQPIGKHNPMFDCVLSSSVKDYISLPFTHLNPVQSEFIIHLEDDDVNIVVSAPTSSGKTSLLQEVLKSAKRRFILLQ